MESEKSASASSQSEAGRGPLNPKMKDSFFFSYECEGLTHARRREHAKAVQAYTKAINLCPDAKTTILQRGQSQFAMGQFEAAVVDADLALKTDQDKVKYKALQLKAEALHAKGDFEFAIVNFHRAALLRPDLHEFQYGIQKATDAINKCFGMYDPMLETPDYMEPVSHTWGDDLVAPRVLRHHGTSGNDTPAGWEAQPPSRVHTPRGTSPGNSRPQTPRSSSRLQSGRSSAAGSRSATPASGMESRPITPREEAAGERPESASAPSSTPHAGQHRSAPSKRAGGRRVPASQIGLTPPTSRGASPRPMSSSGGAMGKRSEKKYNQSLLGALYDDEVFLQQLKGDRVMAEVVGDDVTSALKYLDNRKEYWRKQDPLEEDRKARVKSDSKTARARAQTPRSQGSGAASTTNENQKTPMTPRTPRASTMNMTPRRSTISSRGPSGRKSMAAISPRRSTIRRSHVPDAGKKALLSDFGGDLPSSENLTEKKQYMDHMRFALQSQDDLRKAIELEDFNVALTIGSNFFKQLPSLDIMNKAHFTTDTLVWMGTAWYELADFNQASIQMRKAMEVARSCKYKIGEKRAVVGCATSEQARGKYSEAEVLWRAALRISEPAVEAKMQICVAICCMYQHKYQEALDCADTVLAMPSTRPTDNYDDVSLMKANFISAESNLSLQRKPFARFALGKYMQIASKLGDERALQQGRDLERTIDDTE
ncbi:hypothetical protein CYMTET_48868 [Cymbomonas tetramitiformis]|uniref:Outer dynein arm-docking complex subunit 4 n=1 Tax=Cymbomonas tetramitiformis TaxID=36881 RepID=A0AAE0BSM3_9CHLO|nr:hypothetical protein CYMTET_48868 [Cymbomonas tetramitiformis]